MSFSGPRSKGNKNGVDLLFQKLARLPVIVHLTIAGLLALVGVLTYIFNNDLVISSLSTGFALLFVFMGGSVLRKEMNWYKFLEKHASEEHIQNLTQQGFEDYLMALFSLSGYRLRSALDEVHRQDDADVILERRKEIVLLQTNHWNEPTTGISEIRSLQKAAYLLNANSCAAISLGNFTQEAIDWAKIKGVRLVTARDLVEEGLKVLGFSNDETPEDIPSQPLVDYKDQTVVNPTAPTASWDGPKPIVPKSAIASLPDDYYPTLSNQSSMPQEPTKSIISKRALSSLPDDFRELPQGPLAE